MSTQLKEQRKESLDLKDSDIYLSPLRKVDSELFYSWINDREQVLFNAPFQPISEKEHEEWFESVQSNRNNFVFAIRKKGVQKAIGSCQLVDIHPIHRSAEIRIRIGEIAERGKGFGADAIKCLLKFAFFDQHLHRVFLSVFDTNERAIAVYERAGFLREGRLRQAAFINGSYVDVILMSILKDEYLVTISHDVSKN